MSSFEADMVTSGIIRYWTEDDYRIDCDMIMEEGVYNCEQIEQVIVPKMLWCKEKKNCGLDPAWNKIFRKTDY